MYDPWELIGRYVFTGAILFGVTMLMLIGRLVYKANFTPNCNSEDFFNKFEDEAEKGTKDKWCITLIKTVLWPYGIVSFIHNYRKVENKALDAVMKAK